MHVHGWVLRLTTFWLFFLISSAVSLSLSCCFDADSAFACMVSSLSTNSLISDSFSFNSSTEIPFAFSSSLIFLLNLFFRRRFHGSRRAFFYPSVEILESVFQSDCRLLLPKPVHERDFLSLFQNHFCYHFSHKKHIMFFALLHRPRVKQRETRGKP